MPSRRSVVQAIGVGLVGTVGLTYWQRRRILRYDDLESMEAALEIESPTFDYGVAVSDDHLQASYERTADTFDEVEAELEGADEYEEWLDGRRTPSALPSKPEDAPAVDRRDALSEYRGQMSTLYTFIGRYRYEEELINAETVADRIDEERTALEAIEYDYRGETITEAVVDGAFVDDRHSAAANDLENADRQTATDDGDFGIAYGRLGSAVAERHDADRSVHGLEGDDYGERMVAALEALAEAIEADLETVEWEHDSDSSEEDSHEDTWVSVGVSERLGIDGRVE